MPCISTVNQFQLNKLHFYISIRITRKHKLHITSFLVHSLISTEFARLIATVIEQALWMTICTESGTALNMLDVSLVVLLLYCCHPLFSEAHNFRSKTYCMYFGSHCVTVYKKVQKHLLLCLLVEWILSQFQILLLSLCKYSKRWIQCWPPWIKTDPVNHSFCYITLCHLRAHTSKTSTKKSSVLDKMSLLKVSHVRLLPW